MFTKIILKDRFSKEVTFYKLVLIVFATTCVYLAVGASHG